MNVSSSTLSQELEAMPSSPVTCDDDSSLRMGDDDVMGADMSDL